MIGHFAKARETCHINLQGNVMDIDNTSSKRETLNFSCSVACIDTCLAKENEHTGGLAYSQLRFPSSKIQGNY